MTTPALPKVSCLMVTADRPQFCRRAIRCYLRQTYPNKELVVVDDGTADLTSVLAAVPAGELTYIKLEKRPENVLGRLRNMTLEAARGEFLLQWDDDDWIHPERMQRQVDVLLQGYDACTLHGSLMHLDTPAFFRHPYIGYLPDGWPGSIMHRADPSARYPEERKAEDSVYLKHWLNKRYTQLPGSMAYLHIRCFHGKNTWDQKHFLTKMRNTLPDLGAYLWYRYVRDDLFRHNRFQLSQAAREAFEQYLQDSEELGLLQIEGQPYASSAA
jgi:glycosyltransferase involved in cell wall biosynthesis